MRRILVLVGFVATGLAGGSPVAHAHALVQSSSPANGDVLETSPQAVLVTFTEPPDRGLSQIQVFDAAGVPVTNDPVEAVPGQPRALRAPVPELPEGTYTVSWRVLSTVDGHITTGSFAFGVGEAPEPVAQSSGTVAGAQRPSALAVASRWAFYWGLALLFAGALARILVFRSDTPEPWMLWAAWGVAAIGLVGMFLAERSAAGASAADLLGSERGTLLIARGVAVLLAMVATTAAAVRAGVWTSAGLGGATALAMLVHAYAGHAGAAETAPALHVGVQWLHILGVGTWVGGLVWLLVGMTTEPDERRPGAARRFSTLATVALPAVAATGLLRALDLVGLQPRRLVETGFGLTVLGKIALFAGLVTLGAYNRYRIIPKLPSASGVFSTLRRSVGAEVLLGAAVFGLTGVMAGLPPPAQTSAAREPARVVAQGSDPAGTLNVRLTATPGTAGINRFDVRVSDEDGEPVDSSGIRLSFAMPSRPDIARSELDLERAGPGLWRGQGPNLSVFGSWEIGALVLMGGDSRTVDLEVRTRLPTQNITVSEGDPSIYTVMLPSGVSMQGFVEPGAPGANEIHLTFLTGGGAPQPVDITRLEALPGTGAPVALDATELAPGHFVAQRNLGGGSWTFLVQGSTPEGTHISAYFEENIER
ncbi:MAG: copper resistance protein CopC [Actinomycetota bacterium]|nr:copper resistance protein CopC [Actinomycetota bacterium]